MLSLLLWYLAITLIGWLAFPIAYRLLYRLPDRGVGLIKPLGLIGWGFLFWLPASLRLFNNDAGGILLSLLLLGGVSWLAGRGRWEEMRGWLSENRRVWISAELLFLGAFLLGAAMRAASPDATGTEKPMELAFINAILASPQFPPHDPWLSGYSISYYYFGYVMVALLAKLTATPGAVAFNLGVAAWYGLAAAAGYSLLYNLLEVGWRGRAAARRLTFLTALLGPLFILLVGNFGGFFEALHGAGAFWQKTGAVSASEGEFPPLPECLQTDAGGSDSAFWRWLDVQEWNCPPYEPYQFAPNRLGWWWWRSSRILTDYDLNNKPREVIDEFPAFSYVLGDLHPHVLSMPFVLLAAALALNLYLRTLKTAQAKDQEDWLLQPGFWLAAVVLGGLAFLNIWDFPIYLGLYAAAYGLGLARRAGRWSWGSLGRAAILAFQLALAGVILYLPFYIGFASQAGGLVPSLSFFTRGIHFWLMFGTLLIPLLFWLAGGWPKGVRGGLVWRGVGLAGLVVFGLWLLSYGMGAALLAIPKAAAGLNTLQGGVNSAEILPGSLLRRLSYPGMWLSLLAILGLVFTRILTLVEKPGEVDESEDGAGNANGFVLLLALLACGLIAFPEFFYLRDNFGWRMNTIFKFYFQAWNLLALAAAYAFAWLLGSLSEAGSVVKKAALAGASLTLVASLFFSYFGIGGRLLPENADVTTWSLDGANYLRLSQPDVYNGIAWLGQAPAGVVAEAVGGSYQAEYARAATLSGQPNVLGWPGHEGQWRGGYDEIGSRENDLAQLYITSDWEQAREILARYQIRYVVVGPSEYSKYGERINLDKFNGQLELVYDTAQMRIYQAPVDPE